MGYTEFIYHSISAVEEMEVSTAIMLQDTNEAHKICQSRKKMANGKNPVSTSSKLRSKIFAFMRDSLLILREFGNPIWS